MRVVLQVPTSSWRLAFGFRLRALLVQLLPSWWFEARRFGVSGCLFKATKGCLKPASAFKLLAFLLGQPRIGGLVDKPASCLRSILRTSSRVVMAGERPPWTQNTRSCRFFSAASTNFGRTKAKQLFNCTGALWSPSFRIHVQKQFAGESLLNL